jgi:hypothetical protein
MQYQVSSETLQSPWILTQLQNWGSPAKLFLGDLNELRRLRSPWDLDIVERRCSGTRQLEFRVWGIV